MTNPQNQNRSHELHKTSPCLNNRPAHAIAFTAWTTCHLRPTPETGPETPPGLSGGPSQRIRKKTDTHRTSGRCVDLPPQLTSKTPTRGAASLDQQAFHLLLPRTRLFPKGNPPLKDKSKLPESRLCHFRSDNLRACRAFFHPRLFFSLHTHAPTRRRGQPPAKKRAVDAYQSRWERLTTEAAERLRKRARSANTAGDAGVTADANHARLVHETAAIAVEEVRKFLDEVMHSETDTACPACLATHRGDIVWHKTEADCPLKLFVKSDACWRPFRSAFKVKDNVYCYGCFLPTVSTL